MRYCAWPRCSVKVKSGYCALHERKRKKLPKSEDRPTAYRRGYDAAWQRFKKWYMKLHPDCEWCGEPSHDLHHITPISDGGKRLSKSNVVALCRVCHHRVHMRLDNGGNV